MASTPESDLVARCRQGDSRAWDELFDLHYAALGRFVFQLAPEFTQEDAEEICQETFLLVVKHLDGFEGNSQFQTWLFRIALNKARDYREKQQAAKRGGGQTTISLQANEPGGPPPIDPPSPSPGPDANLMTAEKMALVRKALDELGDPCREVIELRYFGELSYEEISTLLNLHIKTVGSRLSKCLDQLEVIVRRTFSQEKTPFSV